MKKAFYTAILLFCCVLKTLHDEEGVLYSDIVILLRAMTKVDYYENALNCSGIPCNVVDGKGFYGRQEIIDFINLLTVCADSRRNLELAGVLRSPYFAVDDETLTALFFELQVYGRFCKAEHIRNI